MRGTAVTDARTTPVIVLVSLGLFAVYLASMPTSVVGEDDGLFIMAAYYGGLAHPPGYPLYVMINHLVTQLPWGDPAAQVHATTAFFAAGTCAAIGYFMASLGLSLIAVTGTMVLLGLSPLFWSQAIIADVYSLNSFLTTLVLLGLQRAKMQLEAGARLSSVRCAAIGLAGGLALANHWPLFVLAVPGLMLIAWPLLVRAPVVIPPMLLGGLVGLAPYAWLYLRSNTEFVFMGPVDGLGDLWFYVSRQAYSAVDSSVMHAPGDSWRFGAYLAKSWLAQFGVLGGAFLLVGLIYQRRFLRFHEVCGLLVIVVCCGPLLVGMLNFEYNELFRSVISVYFLPVICVLAIWAGLGIEQIGAVLSSRHYSPWLIRSALLAEMMILLGVLGQQNWRSQDSWAQEYALRVLSLVPEGATLFADEDFSSAPLGYFHHARKVRPDLRLMHSYGLLYPNPQLPPQQHSKQRQMDYLGETVSNSEQRVWFTERPELRMGWGSNGLLFWSDPDETEESLVVEFDERVIDYLVWAASRPPSKDTWTRIHRQNLLEAALPAVLLLLEDPDARMGRELNYILAETTRSARGKIALAGALIELDRPGSRGGAGKWLREAEDQEGDLDRRNRVNLYLFQAQLEKDNSARAEQLAQKALSAWPSPHNPANRFLASLEHPGA